MELVQVYEDMIRIFLLDRTCNELKSNPELNQKANQTILYKLVNLADGQ